MQEPSEADGNVLFLETFQEIPDPLLPLRDAGRKAYDEWCGILLRANKLTALTKTIVEEYATAADLAQMALESGKGASSAVSGMRSALVKLRKLDADTVVAPKGGKNKFSSFGFAKRAWERKHSHI